MKTFWIAAALALAAMTPAKAQKLQFDLSTVTCQQFLEYNRENMSLILMWLDGYYSDEDAPPIVDFDEMAANGKKLGEYCAKNPSHSVITASEDVMGK